MDDYENIKANLKSEGYHLCNGWLQSNATEINLSKLNFNDFEKKIKVSEDKNKVRLEGVKISDERVLEFVLNEYVLGNGKLTELGVGALHPEAADLVLYLSKRHVHHDKRRGKLQKFRESNHTRFSLMKKKLNIKYLVTEDLLNSMCDWCTAQLTEKDINFLLEVWAAYNYFIFYLPPKPKKNNIIQYFEEVGHDEDIGLPYFIQMHPLTSNFLVDIYEEDAGITKINLGGHLQLYNKGSFITPHHDGKYSEESQGSARIAATFIYLNDQIEGMGGELVLQSRKDDTLFVYKPKFGDMIILDCYYDICIQHEIKPSYWERYSYVSFNTVPLGDNNV